MGFEVSVGSSGVSVGSGVSAGSSEVSVGSSGASVGSGVAEGSLSRAGSASSMHSSFSAKHFAAQAAKRDKLRKSQ